MRTVEKEWIIEKYLHSCRNRNDNCKVQLYRTLMCSSPHYIILFSRAAPL